MNTISDKNGNTKAMYVSDAKSVKKNPLFKMKTFMLHDTYEVKKNGGSVNDAKWMDYKDVQKYVVKHKKEIFKGAKTGKYQINVLTAAGWKSGKIFEATEHPKFYDPTKIYDGGAQIEDIIAFQVVYF